MTSDLVRRLAAILELPTNRKRKGWLDLTREVVLDVQIAPLVT